MLAISMHLLRHIVAIHSKKLIEKMNELLDMEILTVRNFYRKSIK